MKIIVSILREAFGEERRLVKGVQPLCISECVGVAVGHVKARGEWRAHDMHKG